jgi:adenine-specific DNA-methyltransferase
MLKCFFIPEGPYSKNVVKFSSQTTLNDKYILALINSKYYTYYVKNFITVTHTLQVNDGKLIPIPFCSQDIQNIFIEIVDAILEKKKQGNNIDTEEEKLDSYVYKLMELDFSDVKTIDPNFSLTQEEYENLKIE